MSKAGTDLIQKCNPVVLSMVVRAIAFHHDRAQKRQRCA